MQTLWQYFRISLLFVAVSSVCAVMAILGIHALEKRKPPEAIELQPIGTAWSDYRFNVVAEDPIRLDLELDPMDSTPNRICEAVPPHSASDCAVPAGRIGVEWRLEGERGIAIAGGNLAMSGSQLHFGSFHWLALGGADMKPGAYRLRLRSVPTLVSNELPYERIRFWRAILSGNSAHEAARQTTSWIVATVSLLFLSLFTVMLEVAVWKRQRAPR